MRVRGLSKQMVPSKGHEMLGTQQGTAVLTTTIWGASQIKGVPFLGSP